MIFERHSVEKLWQRSLISEKRERKRKIVTRTRQRQGHAETNKIQTAKTLTRKEGHDVVTLEKL